MMAISDASSLLSDGRQEETLFDALFGVECPLYDASWSLSNSYAPARPYC